jgi:HK97 family phage portal protein
LTAGVRSVISPTKTAAEPKTPNDVEKRHSVTNTSQAYDGSFALTPDYLAFRNTWWGQQQPVNYKMLWKAYLEEPIVRACVDITVDAVIGDGYLLEGATELHVKRVRNVFKKADFQKFLQDTITSLVIYGDAYAEVVRKNGGLVDFFRPVDAATVRIDYDEHGFVMKYVQRVLHRRVDFYPDEMVHMTVNNVGGRVYGLSSLQSVIFTLQAKLAAQTFNTEYFRRNGLPRSLYISRNLSKEQNDRAIQALRSATPQTDIWLNTGAGEVEHQLVSPNNQDMQFVELMNFLRQEIIAAMGVPPIFLGITEGSNRSNSQTQMESWDRKKKKMRLIIQDIINQQLLTASNFGFDDVKFAFNDENSRERLKYGQLAQLLSTIQWITPNEIRNILDLPPMEDKSVRFDSSAGELDMATDEIGDKPLFMINQEFGIGAFAPKDDFGGDVKNPAKDAADPRKNQGKKENAERLNSEQANESRKLAKANPTKDYPFGAVEPEREVTSEFMLRDFKSKIKQVLDARDREMKNQNMDFDNPAQPNKVILPNVVGYGERKSVGEEKATFYKGTDQLTEMGIKLKRKA